MKEERVRVDETPGGIKVISEVLPSYHSVAIGVWGNFGSRDETDSISGITHLIEHLFFRGTGRRTYFDIAQDIEKHGGHINAFTGKDSICVVCRIIDEHLNNALDVISDLLTNSTFTDDFINIEKQVVIREIQSIEDDPPAKVQDMLVENLFSGEPIGRRISGTIETVGEMDREHILAYLSRKLKPANIYVVVSGNVNHDELRTLIEDKLENNLMWDSPWVEQEVGYEPLDNFEERDIELAHIALAVKTPGLKNGGKERYILPVINLIIGGNFSSRLIQKVRFDMGLAYNLGSFNIQYSDTGYFNISCSIPPVMAGDVLGAINDIIQTPITEDELYRSKEFFKGTLTLSLESLSSRMLRISHQFLYFNRHIPITETMENIDSLTLDEVNKTFNDIFSDKFSIAIIGPDVNALQKEVREYV